MLLERRSIALAFAVICFVVTSSGQRSRRPPVLDDDDGTVRRICIANPDFLFCRQYLESLTVQRRAPPQSPFGETDQDAPFPHGTGKGRRSNLTEAPKKKILIIHNEFNPDGTVKIPQNITLDPQNEAELARIKTVEHASFQPDNQWGFESAPPLPADAKLLPAPNQPSAPHPRPPLATSTPLSIPRSTPSGVDDDEEEEYFDFPLPTTTPDIPLPVTLPNYKPAGNDHNGLLKDIGGVNIGWGLAVGAVPDNDPVSVGGRVGVSLGASGRAGRLPYFPAAPFQGEDYSLNDYDGNKTNIVPDRARKTYIATVIESRRSTQGPIWPPFQ